MYSSGTKGSNNRVSSKVSGSRIPTLLFSILWQDSENRVYLIKELDRITGQGKSAISVDDTLKIIACREQQKKLSALEMELAAAKQEGFTSSFVADNDGMKPKKRHLVIIGILTRFGRTNNRNAIRKAWMGTGRVHDQLFVLSGITLSKMENEKGIVARFVIGRSANRGDNLEKAIDNENKQTNDFIILATDGLPNKAKLFFAHAADKWDAEFYAKVNDNVYVNIDALGTTLANHLDKPRVYIGCMKSGEVFFEPYFRHASGEMYVISRALAKFISINRTFVQLRFGYTKHTVDARFKNPHKLEIQEST
ncbi:hypothetical protein JCGZ_26017 [Jatropha curcas]|uniref:Hexosyltransferase n=1 Tax=Jatropha curcas TaxID=180498 RepID=A0A067JE96_JATCU|nr:hypothetical protein JCGZ_26017 [Jatropha curcas]